jgi:very-short-patch-repair endonuclease
MADPHVKFLRQNSTTAETLLWHQLRRKRVGNLRFRRQYRLGGYIVDFVCLAARLIVEVDGDSHDQTYGHDQRRTQWLEGQGFRVIRFWNHEVIDNLEGVVRTIEIELNKAPTSQS